MKIVDQTTELVNLADLKPHPRNPRQGDVGAIHESIEANGFYGTIIAQRSSGHILAGNHRYQAALQQNAEQVPVTWVDVDDDHALRILLADNRTNDLASYDQEELAAILEEIMQATHTLDGTGYDGDDLDELLNDQNFEDGVFAEDREEVDAEAGTVVAVGSYRVQISRADYLTWHDEFREKHGYEDAEIKQAIMRKLGFK